MAKVLLVDADWENLVPLQRALAGEGYEVAVALSGSFALTMLERDRPDLIVSENQIQDMDGYELCSIVRSDPATKDIQFLLLTGPGGPVPGAAARAGVSRVIAGKFAISTLVAQVRELLGGARREDRAAAGGAGAGDRTAADRAAARVPGR